MMEEQDKNLEISEESQQTADLAENASDSGVESPVDPQAEEQGASEAAPTVPMHW